MHNCIETKEQITEFVLDGVDRRPDEVLLAELRACAECRAEFNALNATLRVTTRLLDTAAPAESYWAGYHARLRERIEHSAGESHAKAQRREGQPWFLFAPLRLSVRTSVPVPVPLIAVVLAAFAVFAVLATRQPAVQNPVIVHVPVEVPVVQEKEKIVTRVVYRERRSPGRTSKPVVDPAKVESTFAKSEKPRNAEIPATLMGFKPTEEVKLTIIKGGSQNEK